MSNGKKTWTRIASNTPLTEELFLGGVQAQATEPQSVLKRVAAPVAGEKEMALALAIVWADKSYTEVLKARRVDYDLAAVAGFELRKKGDKTFAILPEDLKLLDKGALRAEVEVVNGAGETKKRGLIATARYNLALAIARAAERSIEAARQESGNAVANKALLKGVLAHKGIKGRAASAELTKFHEQFRVSVPVDVARAFVNKVLPAPVKPQEPSREQQAKAHYEAEAAKPRLTPEQLLEQKLAALKDAA